MKKFRLIIFLYIYTFFCNAQQDPYFSQYMFNQLGFNPAYAGSSNKINSSLLHRNQWLGKIYAPSVQSISIHAPFNHRRNGLGFQVINSHTPLIDNLEITFSYAYRIIWRNGLFSMGLNAGFSQTNTSLNSNDIKDPGDIIIDNLSKTYIRPELGAGFYYQQESFYIGLSVKHLIKNSARLGNYLLPVRQFGLYINAGYKFRLSENIQMILTGLYKYTPGYISQVDFTNHFVFYDKIWGGVSYRSESIVALQTGIRLDRIITRIRQDIKIGYSFDWYSNLGIPTHEIMLIIDWEIHKTPEKIRKQKIQISPFFL